RAILGFGNANLAQFNGAEAPLSALFTRFLRENGAVVPMGEVARVDPHIGTRASDRLIRLARDKAREDNVGYLAAFSQVSGTNAGNVALPGGALATKFVGITQEAVQTGSSTNEIAVQVSGIAQIQTDGSASINSGDYVAIANSTGQVKTVVPATGTNVRQL